MTNSLIQQLLAIGRYNNLTSVNNYLYFPTIYYKLFHSSFLKSTLEKIRKEWTKISRVSAIYDWQDLPHSSAILHKKFILDTISPVFGIWTRRVNHSQKNLINIQVNKLKEGNEISENCVIVYFQKFAMEKAFQMSLNKSGERRNVWNAAKILPDKNKNGYQRVKEHVWCNKSQFAWKYYFLFACYREVLEQITKKDRDAFHVCF